MSTNNWWASKMGAQQPSPSTPPLTPPQPSPFNPAPQQQPQIPQQSTYPPTAAAVTASCPNCRSGNYGSIDPNIKARCYDCGYPVVQSGSGTPGIGQQATGGKAAQPTRQISTANNYNPQGIIGHI